MLPELDYWAIEFDKTFPRPPRELIEIKRARKGTVKKRNIVIWLGVISLEKSLKKVAARILSEKFGFLFIFIFIFRTSF